MAITRTAMIEDDGSGTTGTILNNAWKQELYGQIDANPAWQDVPFAAANFSAVAPMIWTVGAAAIQKNRYAVVGKLLFWSIYISWFSGSNVLTGSPSAGLKLTLPGGYLMAGNQKNLVAYAQGIAGVPVAAGLTVDDIGGTALQVGKSAGGNFALSDVPGIITTIIMEIA
jgi:hypothetical protein